MNNFSIIACGARHPGSCASATAYLLTGTQHKLHAGIVRVDRELFHQIIIMSIRLHCCWYRAKRPGPRTVYRLFTLTCTLQTRDGPLLFSKESDLIVCSHRPTAWTNLNLGWRWSAFVKVKQHLTVYIFVLYFQGCVSLTSASHRTSPK